MSIATFLRLLTGEKVGPDEPARPADMEPSAEVFEDLKAGRIPLMKAEWSGAWPLCPKCTNFNYPQYHGNGCPKREGEHIHAHCGRNGRSSGCGFEWAMPPRDAR